MSLVCLAASTMMPSTFQVSAILTMRLGFKLPEVSQHFMSALFSVHVCNFHPSGPCMLYVHVYIGGGNTVLGG